MQAGNRWYYTKSAADVYLKSGFLTIWGYLVVTFYLPFMRASISFLLLALMVGSLPLITLTSSCQKKQEPAPVEPPVLARVTFEAVVSKSGTSAPGYFVVSRKPIRSSKLEDVLMTIKFNGNTPTPVLWNCAREILKDSLYIGLYYHNTLLLNVEGKPTAGDAVQVSLKVDNRPFTSLRIDANTYQNPDNRWLHYDGKENSGIGMGGRL